MGGFVKNPKMPGKFFYQDDQGRITEAHLVTEDATGKLFLQSESGELQEMPSQGANPPPPGGQQPPGALPGAPTGPPPAVPWGHQQHPTDAQGASGALVERDALETALRTAEFGSRGVVDSLTEWGGLLPDLVAQGLDKVGVPGMPEPGYYGGKLKQGFNALAEQIPNPIDVLGYDADIGPPTTGLERAAYGGGRGVVDAASMLVPGALLARGSKVGTTLSGVGNALKAQPVAQVTAGAVGGGVQGTTDNPYLGMAASTVVPAAPALYRGARRFASRRGVSRDQQKLAKLLTNLGGGDLQRGVRIAQQRLDEGGPDTVLVDVLGDAGERATRGVAARPGRSSETVADFVAGRQSGRSRRLKKAIGGMGEERYYKFLDKLDAKQRRAARPLYDEAFSHNQGFVQWDDELDALMQHPDIIRGMEKGIAQQRMRSAADGTPFNPKDYGIKSIDEETGRITFFERPNLRAMDAAKKGIDGRIYNRKNRNPMTGEVMWDQDLVLLRDFNRKFVSKLDEISTVDGRSAYKEARAAWGGPAKLEDAAVRGRKFLNGDEEMTARMIAKLSPAEKKAFRIGARRQLTHMITQDTQGAIGKFAAKKEDLWTKIRHTFDDDDAFDDFRQAVNAEVRKARVEGKVNVSAGSQTQLIKEDVDDLARIPSAGAAALEKVGRGNWLGAITDYAVKAPLSYLRNPSEEVATRLAKMLTEMDPAAQKKIMSDLLGRGIITDKQRGGRLTAELLGKALVARAGGTETQGYYDAP